MSDFDLMMAKKKEEQTKRRRRKDIDIINDNDDIIAQLLSDMKNAADVSTHCYYLTILEYRYTANLLPLCYAYGSRPRGYHSAVRLKIRRQTPAPSAEKRPKRQSMCYVRVRLLDLQ